MEAAPPRQGVMVSRFGSADVVVSLAFVLVAAAAYLTLPEGSLARLALVAPAVLLVPGYLLVEATASGPTSPRKRVGHALVGLGVSPAFLGVVALATALVPGGFRAPAIVGAITLACFGAAWIVLERRQRWRTERDERGVPRSTPA